MSQTLEFVSSAGNLTLGEDEIVAKDLAKVHTGVGDARVDVPENDAIIPYVQRQDRVNYYVDGSAVWTGYAVGFQGNKSTGKWTLRLDGVGKRLEETRPDYDALGGSLVYQNTALDDAIRDYWGRTPFNATVTDQATELVAQDENLQSADTTAEWNTLYTPADTEPVAINSGELQLLQSGFFNDETTSTAGDLGPYSDPEFEGGAGLQGTTGFNEWQASIPYTIPEEHVGFAVRLQSTGPGTTLTVSIDGTELGDLSFQASSSPSWTTFTDVFPWSGGDLSGSVPIRFDLDGTDSLLIDCLHLYDTRYNYFFDDSVDANNELSGPELYPDAHTVTLDTVTTAYNITEATIASTWNDTSNDQAIAASNDNGANFLTSNNTSTDTFTFNTSGRQAVTRLTLSRYGTRTNESPTTGFNGQAVDSYTLTADLNDLVVIDRMELSRDHFANLKQLHDYGDFLWVIEHDSGDLDTLSVSSFSRGAETRATPFALLNPKNIMPEVAAENYFNSVYLEGALQPDGSRPTAEVKDQDAITADGREITPGVLRDQNVSTEAGATFRANALLQSSLDNDELRGTISTYPEYIHPGYSYEVAFSDTLDFKTLESVSITERAGDVQASYEFVTREALSQTLSELKREGRTIGNQV